MTATPATEMTFDYGHVEFLPVHFDDFDTTPDTFDVVKEFSISYRG
jgi:hypothetical protein